MRVPMYMFDSAADFFEREAQRRVMRDVAKSKGSKNPLARANLLRLDRALLREIKRGR